MAKKVKGSIKLQVPAGGANPAPPVGPALGQHKIDIMGFCKEFNAKSMEIDGIEKGTILPVVITYYDDRSISLDIKSPPASVMIKKKLSLAKGSSNPNTNKVGVISRTQLEEIAKAKMADLTAADLDAAVRTIAGSARSMGVDSEVSGEKANG